MRAFSTLELMIALMIISTTLAGVALIALGLPQALAEGHLEEVALGQAHDLLARTLRLGLYSFSDVSSVATTSSNGIDTALTAMQLADGYTKQLVSTVHWTSLTGQSEYASLTGIVTDYQHAPLNSCGLVLRGDWTHPVNTTFLLTPGNLLPASAPASAHPITAVATGSSTLIATVASSVGKTDPTLFLFDISSSTHPVYLSSLDNATSTKTGIAAATFQGSLIYAALGSTANFATCSVGPSCAQLQILDVSTPTAPVLVTSFQLATTTPPFAIGSGNQSAGKSIAYANSLLYLGLQKTGSPQGEEFNILDVHSPTKPVWLGGYTVGRTINQIHVVGTTAYLATDDPTRELIVLDVHDPAHPSLVASYDAPGGSTYGFGEALTVSSTTVLLGRSYSPDGPGVAQLSTATSSTPSVVTTQTEATSVAGIVLQQFIAFVLTSSQLQFWNTTTSTLVPFAPSVSLPSGSTATTGGLACRNGVLYAASSDAAHVGYLSVITGS